MLLYKRSSFLSWLQDVKGCEIQPLASDDNDRRRDSFGGLLVTNGPIKCFVGTNSKDRISYEEIHLVCNKLYIDGLPGDSDLERLE